MTVKSKDFDIDPLFDEAKENGIDSLYTLLRVEGVTMRPDPLVALQTFLDSSQSDLCTGSIAEKNRV